MSNFSDKRFLQSLKNGDSSAWSRFVDDYGGRVYALARRFAATDTDAEDLTQEIWVQISGSLANFRGDCALSTWVYRVAWNRACRWQKTHGGEPLPLGEETEMWEQTDPRSDPARRAMNGELSHEIGNALEGLSEPHRAVVILHEIHGLTYTECARVLDVPVGTVKSRLSNAFGRLRTALRPYVQDEMSAPAGFTDAIGGKA